MTDKLEKQLKGFDLYILPKYGKVMDDERKEDQEYNMGITYHDTQEDFYAWVDSLSYEELLELIEDYALARVTVALM